MTVFEYMFFWVTIDLLVISQYFFCQLQERSDLAGSGRRAEFPQTIAEGEKVAQALGRL